MDQKPTDIGAILAAAALGAAAEPVWHQIGVIAVGACGGAFWALMQLKERTPWGGALWFMAPRAILAFCMTWAPAYAAQSWLEAGSHVYRVPVTAMMLALSFFLGAPKELVAEFRPLLAWWRRGGKE